MAMMFSTAWDGFACNTLADNILGGPGAEGLVLTPMACVVTLSEFPGLVSEVALPAQTLAVRVWTTSPEGIRLAIDADPVPVGTSTGPAVPATTFTLGDTVLPGAWMVYAVPADSLLHTVHLSSPGVFASALLVALVEP